MTQSLQQLISQSGVQFGTSGARGLVTDFTDKVCAAFSQSFLHLMQTQGASNQLALAIDNRPSSKRMAAACAGAAKALGFSVHYYGVLPTPALACYAMQHNMPAIMVTGSHIPFDRNGLKFYRPDGEITKADEQAILTAAQQLQSFSAMLPALQQTAAQHYCQRYLNFFCKTLLAGKHIGIYQHSSSGRDLYPAIFTALGARVTCLERTDSFVPIDTEAVSAEDKQRAKIWSRQFGFDAIFSTDGDGDRPLLADEQGNWLRGDIVGLLCAKALGIDAIALPVNCNTAIELSGDFRHIIRSKIGSPYVLAAFAKLSAESDRYAGFEANGGFMLGSDISKAGVTLTALPTRDALLPALAVLALTQDTPLSQLTASLPKRYSASDRLQQVEAPFSQSLLEAGAAAPLQLIEKLGFYDKTVTDINQTDGLRLTFSDGDIVHLRPSGNAPELRCYAESASEIGANGLVATALNGLHRLINGGT